MGKWTMEKLQEAHRQALVKLRAKEARVEAEKNRPYPQSGDMYLVKPLPDQICVSWLILLKSPDHDSWFCVPTDDINGWVGTPDCEEDGLVARCGFGLWLSEDMLELDLRVDTNKDLWVSKCRRLMASWFGEKNDFKTTPSQEECDDDPYYEEIRMLVGQASYEVEQRRYKNA